MRTLASLLVVFVLSVGAAFAGFDEDVAASGQLFAQKRYVEAEAASLAILSTYTSADATVDQFMQVRCGVGHAIRGQRRWADAVVQFRKALTDYPNADVNFLIHAQRYVGLCSRNNKKLADARVAYQAALDNYPTASNKERGRAHAGLVGVLVRERQWEAATRLAVTVATTYGFVDLEFQTTLFDTVNPVYLTKAEFEYYLERLCVIVPATDGTAPGTTDNTEFWGRFSSQLDAMNMGE